MAHPMGERESGERRMGFPRGAPALVRVVSGDLHFVATDAYISIMPDYLPPPGEHVYLSGILEILFGLGLLWPKTRQAPGVCLILPYLAVLPADINMAARNIQPTGFRIPVILLWARLPIRLVLIFWAWRVSRPEPIIDRTW